MHRPVAVRYVGLAGSLLLAVAAYLGGARSPWRPTITPGTIFHGENGVLLPVAWLVGMVLLIGAWVAGWRSVPSGRWAYLTAGLWALPLLFFLPLGSYDVYSYACQGWQQANGLDPYAGGVDLLGCPWQAAVAPTWHASPAPYGPVFLVLAALAVKVGGSLTATVAGLRVVAVLGVALIGAGLPALAHRRGVPLGRAVWLALACPLVMIHLISGAHNDAVMVGFVVVGLALAADRRFLVAGVVFGLAVGVKATAIVVVPFALLLATHAPTGPLWTTTRKRHTQAVDSAPPRRGWGWGWKQLPVTRNDEKTALLHAGAQLLVGLAGVLVLVSLVSGRGLGWVAGLAGSGVSVQWTSPSTAVGMAIGLAGPHAVPVTRVIGIVALVGVLVWLWLRARHADPLLYAGLALAATVVLAPVFHPWYATWPLAVLAATVRRETRWLVIPPAIGAALCLPDGYNLALAMKSQGAILMTVFLIVLIGKALHDTKNRNSRVGRPDHDTDRLSRRDA